MKTDIRGVKKLISPAIREHARRRIHFALGRFEDRILSLTLRLSDPNGPRGGQDKCCKIEAKLRGSSSLFVEETGTDLYAAIDLAVERLGHAIRRHVEKRKDVPRRAQPVFGWDNLRE
ncbi:ribosome-associated translation inhibitor RaiA [Deltaproteobacteria bacterium PRO3]|nr:ribosome-associated translation inhibitor RaiA [Deltaproteobacteria bacterium PRO3]